MKIIASFIDDKYPLSDKLNRRNCVRGVVFDNDKIALLKIDFNDIFGQRDYYSLVGGGIEKGETLIAAAKRETKEECGALVSQIKFHGIVINELNLINQRCYNYVYSCQVKKIEAPNLTEEEKQRISSIQWVNYKEAYQLIKNYQCDDKIGVLKHRYIKFVLEKVLKDLKLF